MGRMPKLTKTLLVASFLFGIALAGCTRSTSVPPDFEVPDDYVGPVLDQGTEERGDSGWDLLGWLNPPADPQQRVDGGPELEWTDPDGFPASDYAATFGVSNAMAARLLQWQAALNDYNEQIRSLPSYGFALIVNPSPGDPGGYVVYLKNPTPEDRALIDSLPKPPIGTVRLVESALTDTEASRLSAAEKVRVRGETWASAAVTIAIDWERGIVTGTLNPDVPSAAAEAPDGTRIEISGFPVLYDGKIFLCSMKLDIGPLGCGGPLEIIGSGFTTDTEPTTYFGETAVWSQDSATFTGIIQDGALYVDTTPAE